MITLEKTKCPVCNAYLPILKIKDKFFCPYCEERIKSNHFYSVLVPLTIWALFIPILIQGYVDNHCGNSLFCELIIDTLVGMPVFFVIYYSLLTLEEDVE